ncbi:uncharacterized protein EMH_0044790 [Eimeria mitis]|uniref:Uncharacterized protein n=1 Tax=Eimeria mitis TaxID=44415 RepID=U6KAK3_9EIME|nr:uncharacterized protein EMH_0044790 [Eimeria mitis]CDJ32513.1 hypothetical protein, conserved [Eimeria mitis]
MPGVPRRRLSEGFEGVGEDVGSIIDGCLELEEQLGILHQRASSGSESDSSSRIAELVSMLSEAAATHESVQGSSVAWDVTSADGSSPGEEELHVSDDFIDWEALLEPETAVLESPQSDPLVSPVEPCGSSSIPPALAEPTRVETTQTANTQAEGQELGQLSSADVGDSEGGHSSASLVGPSPGSAEGSSEDAEVLSHPYVRLPVLEEGVVPRLLNTSILFYPKPDFMPPYFCLNDLRQLFARKTLNQRDADALVSALEELINMIWFQAQCEHKDIRPATIAGTYSVLFLAFDSLACAIQLFGDRMQLPLWWDRFVGVIDTRLKLDSPIMSGQGGMCRRLTKRLAAALSVYKTGQRPPLTEVVALKKLVFCSRDRPGMFRRLEWDPWRLDAGCE